jgi:hypothetical protein
MTDPIANAKARAKELRQRMATGATQGIEGPAGPPVTPDLPKTWGQMAAEEARATTPPPLTPSSNADPVATRHRICRPNAQWLGRRVEGLDAALFNWFKITRLDHDHGFHSLKTTLKTTLNINPIDPHLFVLRVRASKQALRRLQRTDPNWTLLPPLSHYD